MYSDPHVLSNGSKARDVAKIEEQLKALATRDLQLWSIVILTLLLFAGGFMSFVFTERRLGPPPSSRGYSILATAIFRTDVAHSPVKHPPGRAETYNQCKPERVAAPAPLQYPAR